MRDEYDSYDNNFEEPYSDENEDDEGNDEKEYDEENSYSDSEWEDNEIELDDGDGNNYFDNNLINLIGDSDTPEHSEYEFGEFANDLNEIKRFNIKQMEFSNREFDSSKAKIFQENTLVDIEAVKEEIKAHLQSRKEILDEMSNCSAGGAKTWQKQLALGKKETALRRKLSFLSVGLTMRDIGGVADDYHNLTTHPTSSLSRDLHKDLKEKMKQLNHNEREQLIDRLYENGRIDDHQYQYLRAEFL